MTASWAPGHPPLMSHNQGSIARTLVLTVLLAYGDNLQVNSDRCVQHRL